MKNKHIDTIRRQLGISLASIQKYNREHGNEIEHIKDIFTLKGDYREKYLALLYMFSGGEEDSIAEKYREQMGMNKADHEPSQLLERYKVLLITALIYNQDFYAMVINSRGFAGAGLSAGEAERDSVSISPSSANKDRIINFPVNRGGSSRSSKRTIYIATAAGFVFIFFIATLIRFFNAGPGPQISNAWGSDIKQPDKAADKIAYAEGMGDRIEFNPWNPDPPKAKGATDDTDDIQATINYYNKAIRGDKNNADLLIKRGIAYTLDGYIEAAVKDFNKAIELDPNNASAYYNRAIANAGREAQIDVVAADLKTAITLNPGDKDAYYAIGVLYYKEYEKDKTATSLETAIDAFERIKGYKDADDILNYLNELGRR